MEWCGTKSNHSKTDSKRKIRKGKDHKDRKKEETGKIKVITQKGFSISGKPFLCKKIIQKDVVDFRERL